MKRAFILLALLLCSTAANAGLIGFKLTALGGNTYQYEYIVNNHLAFTVEEFSVYFESGLYENLAVGDTPALFDAIVIEPDPALDPFDDGLYDALALGPGIAPGTTQGGFKVIFDWLGADLPGAQFFDIVDPFTFEPLYSGETVKVSEPSAALLLIGALLLTTLRRRVLQPHT